MSESKADRLTPLQSAFCLEYAKDFHGTNAAGRAGYTGEYMTLAATASRLLKIDKIKARVAELVQERCMGVDEALARLAEQARSEQTLYLGADGTIDLERMITEGKGHLVKSTKWDKEGRLVVEFEGAQSALDKILKAGGAYKDKGDGHVVNVVMDLDKWKADRKGRLDAIENLDDTESGDGETPNA